MFVSGSILIPFVFPFIAKYAYLQAILKMKSISNPSDEGSAVITPEEAVEKLFFHLDKNRDDKLTELEFVLGAKQAPQILALLQPQSS